MKPAPIVIAIAGMAVAFVFTNAALAARVQKRYRGWIVSRKKPVLRIACVPVTPRIIGRTSAMPRIVAASIEYGHITRRDFDCRWHDGRGTIRMRPSIYTFDACLRVLLCTLLPLRGTLLLHASAVASPNNRGSVFAGRSGSGKTTIARLLGHARVLNDEICAVTVGPGGRARVSGTPFWGEMRTGPALPAWYRLWALYFLKKARFTSRERLTSQEALARLLVCVCHFSRLPGHTSLVLDLAFRIVRQTPVFELRFRRDPGEVATVALNVGGIYDS